MSSSNEKKKANKKRKKKNTKIDLEDYAKEHNIAIDISLKYEDSIELKKDFKKSSYIKLKAHINKDNNFQKIEKSKNKKKILNKSDINISRKETGLEDYNSNSNQNLNSNLNRQVSESTNNSSIEIDNKFNNQNKFNYINNNFNINKNLTEREQKIAKIIKDKIQNSFQEEIKQKIIKTINSKIKEYKRKDVINPYYIEKNNINNNININLNCYINSNYNSNCTYFPCNNDYFNYNMNMNLNNCNNMLSYNYYIYRKKISQNQIILNEIENQIKLLEKKDLSELYIFNQFKKLISYIKEKNKTLDSDKTKEEKLDPEHPYFYTNHLEEIQIKNVLYLIEGLFVEDNLKNDFNLLKMLNRDGYASIIQLESHPVIIKCNQINKEHLKTVFSEHRENEITETVETFDDILIRNKKWIKIKKEIGNIDNVYQSCMNDIKNLKIIEMNKLLDKKKKIINNIGKIYNDYLINNFNIQQYNMKQNQFNNYNIYNNNFNNINKNNVYIYYPNKNY